jgi:hypothetical protein
MNVLRQYVFDLRAAGKFPSSGHEVRPINDLFRPHDCICLVVSFNGRPGLRAPIDR